MPFAPPFCVACRAPAGRGFLCAGCRRAVEWLPPAQAGLLGLDVWAPLRYEGPARMVVKQLKLHPSPALAEHMAAAIVAGAPPGALDYPLVPVPGRRGHDHARTLAVALGMRARLPVLGLLERTGGARQVGRPRAERLRTPPRFRAPRRGAGHVVLVDDVVTTGATLRACADALGAAGWQCRICLAYARTPVR